MNIELIKKNRLYYKKRIHFILQNLDCKHKSILDLGCGEMLLNDSLSNLSINSYLGVDELNFTDQTNFLNQDIITFGKSNSKSYDLIFCLGVLDHLAKKDQLELLDLFSDYFNELFIISEANKFNLGIRLIGSISVPKKKLIAIIRIFLLKIPFTQIVIDLSNFKFIRDILATEVISFYKRKSF